jgi:hypothetical protein
MYAAIGAAAAALPLALASIGARPTSPPPIKFDYYWHTEAVGQAVQFPQVDSLGAKIHGERVALVAVISCSQCSSRKLTPADFSLGAGQGVVLVFIEDLSQVPVALKGRRAFQICAGKDSRFLPIEWRRDAPQVFALANSKIVAVPKRTESLNDFVLKVRNESRRIR